VKDNTSHDIDPLKLQTIDAQIEVKKTDLEMEFHLQRMEKKKNKKRDN
jgi:hypothetical protein